MGRGLTHPVPPEGFRENKSLGPIAALFDKARDAARSGVSGAFGCGCA